MNIISDLALKTKIGELYDLNQEELDKKCKKTLFLFKKQMEEIGGGNFLNSLSKLAHNKLRIYDKEEECVGSVAAAENISERNIHQANNNFVCLCGKQHLKNLHIFSHQDCDENIVIGSSCIKQVEMIADLYKDNVELFGKLTEILRKLKEAEKVLSHNLCQGCENVWIPKNKKNVSYAWERDICKDCLSKYKTHWRCSRCPKWHKIKKTMRGWNKICWQCWKEGERP